MGKPKVAGQQSEPVIYHVGLKLVGCQCGNDPHGCCLKHRVYQGLPACVYNVRCSLCYNIQRQDGQTGSYHNSIKSSYTRVLQNLPPQALKAYTDEMKRYGITVTCNKPNSGGGYQEHVDITTRQQLIPTLTVQQAEHMQRSGVHDMNWNDLIRQYPLPGPSTSGSSAGASSGGSASAYEVVSPSRVMQQPAVAAQGQVRWVIPDDLPPPHFTRVMIPTGWKDVHVLNQPIRDGDVAGTVVVVCTDGKQRQMTFDMYYSMQDRDRVDRDRAAQREQPIVIAPTTVPSAPPPPKRAKKIKSKLVVSGVRTTTAARVHDVTVGQLQRALLATSNVAATSTTQSLPMEVAPVATGTPVNTPVKDVVADRPAATLRTPDADYTMRRFLQETPLSAGRMSRPDQPMTSPDTPLQQHIAQVSQDVVRRQQRQQQFQQMSAFGGMFSGSMPIMGVGPATAYATGGFYPGMMDQQGFRMPMLPQPTRPIDVVQHASERRQTNQIKEKQRAFLAGEESAMSIKPPRPATAPKKFEYPVGSKGHKQQLRRTSSSALSVATEHDDGDEAIYTRDKASFKFQNAMKYFYQEMGQPRDIPYIDDDKSTGRRDVERPARLYYGFPIKDSLQTRIYLTFAELWHREDSVHELGTVDRTDYNRVNAAPYAATVGDTLLTSLNPPLNVNGPDWYTPPADNDRASITFISARRMAYATLKGLRVANTLCTAMEALDRAMSRLYLGDAVTEMADAVAEMANDNSMCWAEIYQMTVVLQRDFILQFADKDDFTDAELRNYRYYAPLHSDCVFNRQLFQTRNGDPRQLQQRPPRPDPKLMEVADTDSEVEDDVVANIDDEAAAQAVDLLDLAIDSPPAADNVATSSVAARTTTAPRSATATSGPAVVAAASAAPAAISAAAPPTSQMSVAVGVSPGLVPAVAPGQVHDVLQQAMQEAQLQVADVVVHATSQGVTGRSTTATAAGGRQSRMAATTLSSRVARPPIAVKPKMEMMQRHKSSVPADNTITVSPLRAATSPIIRIATPSPLHPFSQGIRRTPIQPYASRQVSVSAQPSAGQSRADSPFDTVMHVDDPADQSQADDDMNQQAAGNVDARGDAATAGADQDPGDEDEAEAEEGASQVAEQPDVEASETEDDAEVDPDIEATVTVVDGVPTYGPRAATHALPPRSQATPGKGAQAARAAAAARGDASR